MIRYPKILNIAKNFSLEDLVKCAILYNYQKIYLIAPENVNFIEASKSGISIEAFWQLTKLDFFKYVNESCYLTNSSKNLRISGRFVILENYERNIFNKILNTENTFLSHFLIEHIAKPRYLEDSSKITDRQRSVNLLDAVKFLNKYLENALLCEFNSITKPL